jgi:hypothetical protein
MILKSALLALITAAAVASSTVTPAAKMQDRVSPIVSAAPVAAAPSDEAEPRTAAQNRRADRAEFAPGVIRPASRTVTVERRTGPNTSELVRMPAPATAELR